MTDADVQRLRQDFPLLAQSNLAYLDNAATTQKPACVLNAERNFYEKHNANPLRGLYELSEAATEQYEAARSTVQHFINAAAPEEIIFTRNATESLNLVAYSLPQILLHPGDEIVVAITEHHSNLLPWQQAAKRSGAVLRYLECDADGVFTPAAVEAALTDKTKLLAITQISNVLGRINDLQTIATACHRHGALLVADGAQSVPHIPVDVQALDVDFLAFSGHKMLGPMGIGVLYGKRELLEKMPPFLFGGEMIESVTREGAVYAELPHKFEAGTVNAAGAVALAEAIRYIQGIGLEAIHERELALCELALNKLNSIPHVHILGGGTAATHNGILTFTVEGIHPHDVAEILSADGIAVRAGHHCAQPLLAHLGVSSATRASLAFYNTEAEIDRFAQSLQSIRRRMGYAE